MRVEGLHHFTGLGSESVNFTRAQSVIILFFVSCSFESVVTEKAGSIFRNTLINDVSVMEFDILKCDTSVLFSCLR